MAKKKLKRKYPDGVKKVKKDPIYVESKDDPRYVAYQDSLALHNASEIGRRGDAVTNPFGTDIAAELVNAVTLAPLMEADQIRESSVYNRAFESLLNTDRYVHPDNPNLIISNTPPSLTNAGEPAMDDLDEKEYALMLNELKKISFPVTIHRHTTPDITVSDPSSPQFKKFKPIGSYTPIHSVHNFAYKKPEQEVIVRERANKFKLNSDSLKKTFADIINTAEENVNKTSLVNLMKERGEDSSFDARKKLYNEYGLDKKYGEFTGTAEQGDMLTRSYLKGKPEPKPEPTTSLTRPRMNIDYLPHKDPGKMGEEKKYPNGVSSVPQGPKRVDPDEADIRKTREEIRRIESIGKYRSMPDPNESLIPIPDPKSYTVGEESRDLDRKKLIEMKFPKLSNGINLNNIGEGIQGVGGLMAMYGAAKGGDKGAEIAKWGGTVANAGGLVSTFGQNMPEKGTSNTKMPIADLSDAPADIDKAYKGAPDPMSSVTKFPAKTNISSEVEGLPNPGLINEMDARFNPNVPDEFAEFTQANKGNIYEYRHGRRGLMMKYGCYMKPKGKK